MLISTNASPTSHAYETLDLDKNSRLAIRFNIFWFSAIPKFQSFPLVCRAQRDKSSDAQHQRFRIKTKSSYSFEDCGRDCQTESISKYTLKDLSNDMTHLTKLKIIAMATRKTI